MPNTITPIPRDTAGRLQLPGQTLTEIVTDFSHLTAVPTTGPNAMTTTGTVAMGGTLGESYLAMTAPGNASIKYNAPINANTWESIAVTFDFDIPASDSGYAVFFDVSKNTSGVGLRRIPRVLRTKSGSHTDLAVATPMGVIARQVRYTQTVVIIPGRKLVGLVEGDQVVNAAVLSDILFTDPLDAILTLSGTGTLYLRKMKLDLRR